MTDALRVLIVEDDPVVARLHTQFVDGHQDFQVVGVAGTGAAALSSIDRLQPDLVLLDLYLPDINGLQLLAQIRAQPAGSALAVVAVTAARDLASIRQAHSGGVLHYLVKPFTASDLRSRLYDVSAWLRRVDVSAAGSLDQQSVDAIIARSANALPKGLGRETLLLIESTLASFSDDASAQDVAERAGLSRVSARRYLEYLKSSGVAEVSPRYGRTGRPEMRYRTVRPNE